MIQFRKNPTDEKPTAPGEFCFQFTRADLANLVWAAYFFPSAADAVVRAENACTDHPVLRSDPRKGNAYIRACLDAIARRREHVEEADALFDCGPLARDLLDAIPAPQSDDVPPEGPSADPKPKGPAKRKATPASSLWPAQQ